jgi:putative membrane protein
MIDGSYFWGMHLVWWFVWATVIFWIFATPYDIPGQRKRKDQDTSLDILQKRFASGQFSAEEYQKRKDALKEHFILVNQITYK